MKHTGGIYLDIDMFVYVIPAPIHIYRLNQENKNKWDRILTVLVGSSHSMIYSTFLRLWVWNQQRMPVVVN